MSADDSLPVADDYVAKVNQWLATTDLSGLPEPSEPDSVVGVGCVGLTDGTPVCALATNVKRQNGPIKRRICRMLSNRLVFIKKPWTVPTILERINRSKPYSKF